MKNDKTVVLSDQEIFVSNNWASGFQAWLDSLPLAQGSKKQYISVARVLTNKRRLTFFKVCDYIKGRAWKRAGAKLFLEYIKRKDLADRLPRIKRTPGPPRDLITNDQFKLILCELDNDDLAVAMFLRYTGSRVSEAMGLKMKDVNIKNKTANVYIKKTNNYRPVSLPDLIIKNVMKLKTGPGILDGEYVFYRDQKGNLETKVKRFWDHLQRASWYAIKRKIGTHDFRRFYATYLYEKTRDIQLVARLMGISPTTAQVYTQYATGKTDIEKARQLLGDL